MKVMKFGGSSVKNATQIEKVVSIFGNESGVGAVICSAMQGVTDSLIDIAQKAESNNPEYKQILSLLKQKHLITCKELIGSQSVNAENTLDQLLTTIENSFKELQDLCHGISLVQECTPRTLDLIMSFGERLSNKIISAYAEFRSLQVFYVDSRELILSNSFHGNAIVDLPETMKRIESYFSRREGIGIVTGFIAANAKGVTTTLGRNGSDYTASIFAAALGASRIEIWTDVDGILEVDPRVVPHASVIKELSIDEAMELSYFGAEVLHPSTMLPAINCNIPVWIKNTMNPNARGSKISAEVEKNPNVITGIASISKVVLINIIGSGMIGPRGTTAKIFAAFAQNNVNVIMISQASSEHSICAVIREAEAESAYQGLQEYLKEEIDTKIIKKIEVRKELEIIAIIGTNMCGQPGVSGKLFQTLGAERINIHAIAQGSTEMNISFVISRKDHERSLQSLHKAFFSQGDSL